MVSLKSPSDLSPMASSQPPSIYQPSIYSSYSYPYPIYNNRNGSCERLLPKKPLLPQSTLRYSGPRTTIVPRQINGPVSRKRMASNGIPIAGEQKKSYGIGGAGNIRRPSEVIYPTRTNADGTRRRSSVWSSITATSPSSSPDGKRNSLMNLFSKKGGATATDGDMEGYKDPESGEGRKD